MECVALRGAWRMIFNHHYLRRAVLLENRVILETGKLGSIGKLNSSCPMLLPLWNCKFCFFSLFSDIRNLPLQELSETGVYFCKLEPRIPIQPPFQLPYGQFFLSFIIKINMSRYISVLVNKFSNCPYITCISPIYIV